MGVNSHHEQVVFLFKRHFGDKELTGIEIGSGGGTVTVKMMDNFPRLHLFCVEPFKRNLKSDYDNFFSQDILNGLRESFFTRLSSYMDKITLLEMLSDGAIDKVPKEVDFVWVDGDHSFSQVERDIENYLPLVKKGGIFGGHDYHILNHLVNNLLGNKYGYKIHTGVDLTYWVFV